MIVHTEHFLKIDWQDAYPKNLDIMPRLGYVFDKNFDVVHKQVCCVEDGKVQIEMPDDLYTSLNLGAEHFVLVLPSNIDASIWIKMYKEFILKEWVPVAGLEKGLIHKESKPL